MKKETRGRKPLDDFNVKFEVRVFVSKAQIAQDNGVSQYLKAMNTALDKRIKK